MNKSNFEIYKKWAQEDKKGRIINLENNIRDKVIRAHFHGHSVGKKKRETYTASQGYKDRYSEALEKNADYQSVLNEDISDAALLKTYSEHQALIDEMISAGCGVFTDKAVKRYLRRKRTSELIGEAYTVLGITSPEELPGRVASEYSSELRRILEDHFLNDRIQRMAATEKWDKRKFAVLDISTYKRYIEEIPSRLGWCYYCDEFVYAAADAKLLIRLCFDAVFSALPADASDDDISEIRYTLKDKLRDICLDGEGDLEESLMQPVMTKEEAVLLLRKNPNYIRMFKQIDRQAQIEKMIKDAILDHIPEDLVDLYPAARLLHRKFILHIGPTNSGKTYSAVEKMLGASNGIYLGPLRLLAYEQYEKITAKGIACDLVTGEEEIITGGCFQASTIDVLNFHKHYESAVIDEAQMITDEYRGGRWTSAILGILADEVHICAAPEAEEILIKMINECGDEYEIVRHKRMCRLDYDEKRFDFPEGVSRGDALIVFSRRAVHSLAAELQRRNIKCSVIYGALPYDVRHEEARRFMEGETEVLVATDAIGMGLNLPIKRVVLMENRKFDGREQRLLNASEIKQIVGRAGRAGIFDTGLYTALAEHDRERLAVKRLAGKDLPQIDKIRLAFPEELLSINGKVSELFLQWDGVQVPDMYIKASAEREMKLAKELEQVSEDKKLIYELITIPFDEKRPGLYKYWLDVAQDILKGSVPEIIVTGYDGIIENSYDMRDAEDAYAMLDLQYQLCRKFGTEEKKRIIMAEKTDISEKICDFLARQSLLGRACSVCGRLLPWNSERDKCKKCRGRG